MTAAEYGERKKAEYILKESEYQRAAAELGLDEYVAVNFPGQLDFSIRPEKAEALEAYMLSSLIPSGDRTKVEIYWQLSAKITEYYYSTLVCPKEQKRDEKYRFRYFAWKRFFEDARAELLKLNERR